MPATLPADQYFKHDAIAELLLRDPARGNLVPVHTRVSLVPGIAAGGPENPLAVVEILRASGAKDVKVLPYNPRGWRWRFAWAGPSRKFRPQS